jgi:opacity protein-like surface antigen
VRRLLPLVLVAVCAPPASAQRNELALVGGYTSAGDIDKKAPGIETLEVSGSFTWGVAATRFFSDHIGAEASWVQQDGDLVIGTGAGSAELFELNVGLLTGSFVYRFGAPGARIQPFLLAGLGAAFLDAEDLEGETKLSWAVGAGLKWFPSKRVGARAQARYVPILLDDSSSEVCDPFGFCQGSLHQFELSGGLAFRF